MPPKVAWWRPLFLIAMLPIGVFGNFEGDALTALRQSLDDPNNVMGNWFADLVNPCPWLRVTCNSENLVQRLDFGNAGVSGRLVPEIGVLTNLQYLELYGNDFNGTLPSQLGNLSALLSLDLHQNNFTGPIPSSLGRLSKLRFLRLNNNSLSGTIPASLTTIQSLQALDLSYNDLTGDIPTNGSFSLFTSNSFVGNAGLCGGVLGKQCPRDVPNNGDIPSNDSFLHFYKTKDYNYVFLLIVVFIFFICIWS